MTTEQKVADTILNEPIRKEIDGVKFEIPRPTLATIIEASKMLSAFNVEDFSQDQINMHTEVMRLAKEYDGIERVLAMFVLGYKKAKQGGLYLFGKRIIRNNLDRCAEMLKTTLTPKGLAMLFVEIMASLDSAFFLALITSLNKVNHLKPTKETTASGH